MIFSFKFSKIATRETQLQIACNNKFSFLVDDLSADLDVADELAVIEYVPKHEQS